MFAMDCCPRMSPRHLALRRAKELPSFPRTLTILKAQKAVTNPSLKNVFIFGLGYTSIALGNSLAASGWTVSGTCRTPSRVDGLRNKGWNVGCYDPAHRTELTPELRQCLAESSFVLSSIPPLGLAMYDPALSAQKALMRPLATAGRLVWFGYLSSTGVYGNWQGEWVDESSPCRQTSSKAIVRQEAEAAWLKMYEEIGLPVHVFRLGGIYGPGRSVLDSLGAQSGDLSSSQERRGRQRYTARCHVYDICAVLAASMALPNPGRVYNVVDDDPAPRGEVMLYARALVSGGTTLYDSGFTGMVPAPPPLPPQSEGPAAPEGPASGTSGPVTTMMPGQALGRGQAVSPNSADAFAGDSGAHGSSGRDERGSGGVTSPTSRGVAVASTVGGPSADEKALVGRTQSGEACGAGVTSPSPSLPSASSSNPFSTSSIAAPSSPILQLPSGPPAPSPSSPSSSDSSPSSPPAAAALSRERAILEEKRVRNVRIREELGVVLKYPTYREGVAAIWQRDTWPLLEGDLALLATQR